MGRNFPKDKTKILTGSPLYARVTSLSDQKVKMLSNEEEINSELSSSLLYLDIIMDLIEILAYWLYIATMKIKNKNKNISSKQDQFSRGHLEVQIV